MADLALYRKYRPQSFSDIVGQKAVKITLQNAVKKNAIAHGYLFCGSRGTGKTSTARLMAKTLCCEQVSKTGEPCNKCDICKDIESGRLIDLVEIDAASNRGIDEMRDLKEKIHFAPTRTKAKVYIIDEVHMLTKEAFNALLKTLEEPPSHSYFILATTEAHKIPETIISRCQRFDFKRIGEPDLVERLKFIAEKENIEFEETALMQIVKYVNGGMRDAIGLLEQIGSAGKIDHQAVEEILGVSSQESLEQIFTSLLNGDSQMALQVVDTLFEKGQDFTILAKDLMWYIRGKMIAAVQNSDLAQSYLLLSIIEDIHQSTQQLAMAPIPQLPLEAAIIKICNKSQGVNSPPKVATNSSVPQPSTPAKTKPVPASPAVTTANQAPAVTAPLAKKTVTTAKDAAGSSALTPQAPARTATPAQQPAQSQTGPVNNGNISPFGGSTAEKTNATSTEEEETTQPKKKAIVVDENKTVSLPEIEAKWKETLKKINKSAWMRSLQQGKLIQVKDNELQIEFDSQFHFDNITKNCNVLVQLEELLMIEFACNLKVKADFKPKPETDNSDQLLEKAEELFG